MEKMKKILITLSILNAFFLFSQEMSTVIDENFDNNNNNWEISTKNYWSSTIKNGKYLLKNNDANMTSYFKQKKMLLRNKLRYELNFNFKINLIENNSSAGLILLNDENIENDSYSLILGYSIIFVKYDNKFYLNLNKSDLTGYDYIEELQNFDTNKTHNIKIIINNETPKTSILIDNKLILEKQFPLFNFHNFGFYQLGKVSMEIDNISIRTSKEENRKFMYDVMDKIYNSDINTMNILKGNQYINELTKYVPKAILYDDYDSDFIRFKKEFSIDENCENFKTTPEKDNINNIFSFYYKSNLIYTLVSKQNTFTTSSVVFKTQNNAVNFFNLYSKAKGFKIENERAYLPLNSMKAIILNKDKNSVTIFY